MSEYQYYDFQAVDRPLSQREMAELRALSSRATITPTWFVNVYNWGNFRGNPAVLMETYFDAFVYVANWGTREFMLRLPRRLLDSETAARYVGEYARMRVVGDVAIIDFLSEDESGAMIEDGEDGEEWLPALLPLRTELAGGELRCLYLGWLLCAQSGILDDDDIEPSPPPGLHSLSASLRALADFLRIDNDLIEVAAEGSAYLAEARPSRHALEQWVRGLTGSEKDGLLLRLLEDGDPHLRAELLQRYRRATTATVDQEPTNAANRRTVGRLLADAAQRTETRRRVEAERAAQERARRERKQAAARAQYLDHLATRESDVWPQIDTLIATKRPADYDHAVGLLTDLRDLYRRTKRDDTFEARLNRLRDQHARKPSLLHRFDQAGLGIPASQA